MTRQIPTLATNQRGEGIGGIVAMIILFVMSVKLGLAIIPAHLDDRTFTSVMGNELRQANANKKDVNKLFQGFKKQLTINGYYDVNPKEMFQVTNSTPGGITLKKKYVTESMLFPGVFITNKFEGDVEEVLPE